jgi:serine phosphatase RsbU (regulator of sigma subunit)
VLNVIGYVRYANIIILDTVFIGGVWGLIVGFNTIKKGQPASVFIFLGYTSFIFGGMLHMMCLHGFIPYNWFTHNTYLIGSGLEVFFLSFSFGVNLNTLRKDKYKSQLKIVKMAQENEEFVREQNKILEERVEARTTNLYDAYAEIQTTLNTLHQQKMLIEEKGRKITDSITYAKRIQDALLPELNFAKNSGLDIGILYEPKDILSGDFYWFGEKNNKTIIAVADCTGHGVPGAMMSITGHNLLNKIVHEQGMSDVDEILNNLHIELIALLKAEQNDTQDGMDIQLISIDKTTNETHYSGARNPIYYIDTEQELQRIKADRFSIGGTQTDAIPKFTKHILPNQWINIFLCSDGYQDQFGGLHDKKFTIGRLKNSLKDINRESPSSQIDLLKDQLTNWQGNEMQTDDVLIMSIKQQQIS